MRRAVICLVLVLCCPSVAGAHDARVTSVARVFFDQLGERRYALSVNDVGIPPFAEATSLLPFHCRRIHEASMADAAPRLVFECDKPLTFDDVITLPWALGVVAIARWADGSVASAYFAAEGDRISIRLAELGAAAGSRRQLAQRYVTMGMEHILLGFDHLLFVLGLLLLVPRLGALVKTITAFTIAHSLTLAAAVLGFVPVDSGPVEAAIALSIVLLAREIVVARRGVQHLVHRSPWLVAFVFGSLHGFGFAGAIGEIGLRSDDIPVALLFFNIGVEAGQLAFVAAMLALMGLLGECQRARPWVEPVVGYCLGVLATLWFFDRMPALWA